MRRSAPDEPYARDAGPVIVLPDSLEQRCSFTLYPYVSNQFIEAITWDLHAEAIEQLKSGTSHPGRNEVIELARLAQGHRGVWNSLSREEQDWLVAHNTVDDKLRQDPVSNPINTYLDLDKQMGAVQASLHSKEMEKIRRALSELQDWLVQACQ
ncbi:hypothetical protein AYO44_15830 [Planctomycetaceae bacterium SCGC AG-212-F19]|nr:hypothetical protein AYO44_15830 [Planctomycetaceae bacterium SCGC AG-212-F19]